MSLVSIELSAAGTEFEVARHPSGILPGAERPHPVSHRTIADKAAAAGRLFLRISLMNSSWSFFYCGVVDSFTRMSY